jgi:site-specific DNA-methyltransferase (adenine-specific)
MDCLEGMKRMFEESVDLIVTDPPYRTTSRGNAGNSGGMLQKDINKKGKVFNYNNIEPNVYIPQLYKLLKNGGHFYIMTNHVNLQNILNVSTETGFKFIKSLIWNKGNKIMGQYYMSQFEYILFFRKGKGVKINHCGTSDILSIPNLKSKAKDGSNLHDTEKPIELMEILIENSSNVGQTIFDPFVGIGSTAIACINTDRKYIGFELDPTYYAIAEERIKKAKQNKLLKILEV